MKSKSSYGARLLTISIAAFISLLPVLFIFFNSFMSILEAQTRYTSLINAYSSFGLNNGSMHYMEWGIFPEVISLTGFKSILLEDPTNLRFLWNSIILTVPIVIGQLVIAPLAAYGFEIARSRHKEKLFFTYIVTMLMPMQAVLVPHYIAARLFGIEGNYLAIILPAVFSPFGVFLLRQQMKGFELHIIEAARIDGASELRVFFSVVLPNLTPSIVALAVLAFAESWNIVDQSLTLYISDYSRPLMRKLAQRYNQQNPGVNVQIETYSASMDSDTSNAIAARLISDPPDIVDSAFMNNAKLDERRLFVDIKPLLDGVNGVDRNNYFNDIFLACETSGAMYHVPLVFSYDFFSLSKQYMADIGVNTAEMDTLNYAQLIEFWQRATELNPDEEIYLYFDHSIASVFWDNWSSIFDRNENAISVDIQKLRSYLEIAGNIPSKCVLTPEGGTVVYTSQTVNQELFVVTDRYIAFKSNTLVLPYLLFLSDTVNMKYAPPVLGVALDGFVPFWSVTNLSISHNCENMDLAWSFVRFCLESTLSMYNCLDSDVVSQLYFPINRSKFINQLEDILEEAYEICVTARYINITTDENEDIAIAEKNRAINDAIMQYMQFADQCNYELLSDSHISQLVYDDVYLFFTGYQDVDVTLRNIQNRLEVYINE